MATKTLICQEAILIKLHGSSRLVNSEHEVLSFELLWDAYAQIHIPLMELVNLGIDPGIPRLFVLPIRIDRG